MKKKILVVTERRADYSKLRPILKEIEKSKNLDYYLIVTGTHLLKNYGYSIDEIKNDGFKIHATFKMHKSNDSTGADMVSAFGRAILKLSTIIEKVKPDIVLSGFDIGGNFALAIAGAHMNIIVAHVEGGEITGTIDESIRHAMTKFSHIHFTSNADASKRIVKMGENPKFVFTVGNTSLDGIKKVENIPIEYLGKKYHINFKKPYIIVLQHTVTTEIDSIEEKISQTIKAIKELEIQCIVIGGNADAGSKKIDQVIKDSKIKKYLTVPYNEYVNLLKHCSALVGNSSSGIIEAPFLHIPTINIGTRQDGRLRAESIIDVKYNKNEIKKAINKCINDTTFLNNVKTYKSLYGNGDSAKKIVKILENIDLKKIPIQKKMGY